MKRFDFSIELLTSFEIAHRIDAMRYPAHLDWGHGSAFVTAPDDVDGAICDYLERRVDPEIKWGTTNFTLTSEAQPDTSTEFHVYYKVERLDDTVYVTAKLNPILKPLVS